MTDARQLRNLALIGFMGTGKSTVGHLLAAQLRFQFVDTDALIEHQTGRSIAEIFAQQGEAAFRQLETEAITRLGQEQGMVISTGGGLAAWGDNLERLKSHALVVCLWAGPETIWQRVRHQSHRPLLHDPDPMAKIRHLLAQREPFYRQADVLISTEQRSAREVAQQISHQFLLARQPHS